MNRGAPIVAAILLLLNAAFLAWIGWALVGIRRDMTTPVPEPGRAPPGMAASPRALSTPLSSNNARSSKCEALRRNLSDLQESMPGKTLPGADLLVMFHDGGCTIEDLPLYKKSLFEAVSTGDVLALDKRPACERLTPRVLAAEEALKWAGRPIDPTVHARIVAGDCLAGQLDSVRSTFEESFSGMTPPPVEWTNLAALLEHP